MARPKPIDFAKAKEEVTILSGMVKIAERGIDVNDGQNLIVDCNGKKVIIVKEEIEPLPFGQSFTRYVGTEIKFVVIDYVEEVGLVYGSNKKAIEMLKKPIMEKLNNGEVVEGNITYILNHGAYVSIGMVSGLLKNQNFSDDGTRVGDIYREGEKIRVKLLRMSERGNLLFAPEKKIKGDSEISIKDYERGQQVSGIVVKVCIDKVYVNIAPGLDMLCPFPDTVAEIKEGDFARMKITKVFPEKKRVRGIILSILN